MRQKIVKEYIVRALLELLKQKELSKITVDELVKKAGVCRSSYYRNFFLMEGVVEQYLEALLNSVLELYPIDLKKPYAHMLGVYQILFSQREVLSTLHKRNLLHLFDETLYRVCSAQIEALNAKTDDEYYIYFYTGAASFVIKAWIKNGFKETPKKMAELSIQYYFPKTDEHTNE